MELSMQTQNMYLSLAMTLLAILLTGYVLYRRKKTGSRKARIENHEEEVTNRQQTKQPTLANLPESQPNQPSLANLLEAIETQRSELLSLANRVESMANLLGSMAKPPVAADTQQPNQPSLASPPEPINTEQRKQPSLPDPPEAIDIRQPEQPSLSNPPEAIDPPQPKQPSMANPPESMETQQTKQPSLLQNLPPGENYEVFLSFRGKDTRKGFTDHLYNGLVDAGVWVFRDDNELPVGEVIGPELIKAIKGSKVSIPIISEDYTSSKWCLRELVEILDCKRRANQIVLPIFYKVEPSDVRHISGRLGEVFASHQYQHTREVFEGWKTALREVGSLKGWESDKIAAGHEGELVKLVVRKVLLELKKAFLVVSNNLVGVDNHVENIMRLLDANSNGVCTLGIHGMGGIGKTTLAKIIYNKICEQFEYCSFLADVRETSLQHKGLEGLQKQLVFDLSKRTSVDISNIDQGIKTIQRTLNGKKVLILFDDVDDRMKLNNLVGEDVSFHVGSIIIITTRNKHVLEVPQVNSTYELAEMNFEESFRLFSKHAFRRDYPIGEYVSLSEDIVSTMGGLPLAIEIIGSFLYGGSKGLWEGTLKKLKKIPNEKVQERLRISYDALSHEQKEIFLDIACLPIQTQRKYAEYMWADCEYLPEHEIEVLCLMSLVKVGKGDELRMHDQLRDLGREIVREECYKNPGQRSRLWSQKEALDVLEGMQGTEKVEALCLDLAASFGENHFTSEHFQNLTMLRFLQMNHATISGDFSHLFQKLRWLRWEGCPSDFMLSNIHPKNLVVLDLSYSRVTGHWEGWKHFELAKKLKVLRLEHCLGLVETPDFSPFMELEVLILEECKNLRKIHQSLGDIKTLVILNVKDCERLKELPAKVGQMKELKELLLDRTSTSIETISISEGSLGKLEILTARSCQSLVKLPSSIGQLTSLLKLDLSNCRNLIELPDSIGHLERLSILILSHCVSLTKIPETIGQLKSLTELHLRYAQKLMALPNSIGDLGSLEVLNIRGIKIKNFPSAIRKLRNLKMLNASSTSLQMDILGEIAELSSLQSLQLEAVNISFLLHNLFKLSNLHTLNLKSCHFLEALPELPSGLSVLKFSCKSMRTFPDISNLHNLKHLEFSFVEKEKHLEFSITSESGKQMLKIGKLSKLETLIIVCSAVVVNDFGIFQELKILELHNVSISSLSVDIEAFPKLRKLNVQDCNLLEYLPELPFGLVALNINHCPQLKKITNLSNLKHLYELRLSRCSTLMEITGLEGLESLCEMEVFNCEKLVSVSGLNKMKSLERLEISFCKSLEEIVDLLGLKALTSLTLRFCPNLPSVEGIEKLTSLKILYFEKCKFMENFPNLSELKNLKTLDVGFEDELVEIPGLEKLKSLRELEIMDCKSLERLPNFSIFTALESLKIYYCEKLKELQGLESLESSSCMVDIRHFHV